MTSCLMSSCTGDATAAMLKGLWEHSLAVLLLGLSVALLGTSRAALQCALCVLQKLAPGLHRALHAKHVLLQTGGQVSHLIYQRLLQATVMRQSIHTHTRAVLFASKRASSNSFQGCPEVDQAVIKISRIHANALPTPVMRPSSE